MTQAKFSLEESHVNFLSRFKKYGFKDKSALIRAALERLEKELEMEKLKSSAEIYASLCENDKELQELTNSAMAEWPE